MDPTLVMREMPGWMLTLAVDGELIPGGWRIGAGPRSFIAHIGPDPSRLGATIARCLHLDRGVVGEECKTTQDMAADRVG